MWARNSVPPANARFKSWRLHLLGRSMPAAYTTGSSCHVLYVMYSYAPPSSSPHRNAAGCTMLRGSEVHLQCDRWLVIRSIVAVLPSTCARLENVLQRAPTITMHVRHDCSKSRTVRVCKFE